MERSLAVRPLKITSFQAAFDVVAGGGGSVMGGSTAERASVWLLSQLSSMLSWAMFSTTMSCRRWRGWP